MKPTDNGLGAEEGRCSMSHPVPRAFECHVVLITGGTKGIGLATALAFAKHGARCILTHRWGSADEEEIRQRFRAIEAPEPLILEADAGCDEDTAMLVETVRKRHASIDTVVSGVAFAQVVRELDEYSRRGLTRSIEYTAWPMIELTRKIHESFGRYPRYVIGLSSGGPDQFYANYDFAAAAKSVLETLCRYLAYRLRDEDVRVNVVRARFVRTESLTATLGEEFVPFVERYDEGLFLAPEEVANAVLALASGLMDGVRGQVLMIDRGSTFSDNLMRMYDERVIRSVVFQKE